MNVKHIVMALAATLIAGTMLSAQTPEEIVQKMSTEMQRGEAEGFAMDLSIKMPIIGTVTAHNLINGKKLKSTIVGKDRISVSWSDPTTKWEYESTTGEITISSKDSPTAENNDTDYGIPDGIVDGYKLKLRKETPEAWYILCKKARDNKDKDDPKKMELVVSKATYLPVCISSKRSLISVMIENYTLGVPESSVTFNPDEFPEAKIIDKR